MSMSREGRSDPGRVTSPDPETRTSATRTPESRPATGLDAPREATRTTTYEAPTYEVVDEPPRAYRDRIRWGAVWAGLVVAVATYIVLQLLLIAVGAIDITTAAQADAWWSAGAALVAFFLGGATAGACAIWADLVDGLLHGIVMWAIAVAVVLVLSVFGGGLVMGALDATGAFDRVTVDLQEGTVEGIAVELGADDAQEAASWALLGLGAALLAAAAGAVLGAALWPRTREVRGADRRALVD